MRVRREKDEQGSLGKVRAMEIASHDACVERDVFQDAHMLKTFSATHTKKCEAP